VDSGERPRVFEGGRGRKEDAALKCILRGGLGSLELEFQRGKQRDALHALERRGGATLV